MSRTQQTRRAPGRAERGAAKSRKPHLSERHHARKPLGTGIKSPVPKSVKSRDAILESAAKLFRKQGYSATTLRQIASVARIEAGSIYYYFDSKEAILDEVLDRGLRHVFESVKASVSAKP